MSFGVTPEGFNVKTLEDILEELADAQKTAFGAALNTQSDSVIGQLNAIHGDQVAQLWLVALAIYRSIYPDSASAEALDGVGSITGALRLPAGPSTVDLMLNIADGVTVPAGSIVSIGTGGAQWETLEDAINSGADPANIAVEAESSEDGPIVGNSRAIDTIVTPISGWSAKAAITSGTAEPFELADGQTFEVLADDTGEVQTVTFDTGDFADITQALADEVVDVLNAALDGITASEVAGFVRLTSDTEGTGSAVQISGGDAHAAIGFARELTQGFNWDESAKSTSAIGPWNLDNEDNLLLKIDGGGEQEIVFSTGDFVDINAATPLEVAVVINAQLTGAVAYVSNTDYVLIESLTVGSNSSVESTGGDANDVLAFAESIQAGNANDATLGRDNETDAAFRLRREELLRISGAAALEAVRSAVRAVDDVVQAYVFENVTDVTDINNLPPHTFEVVVSGGDDDAIAAAILDTKPLGIDTYRDPGSAGRTVTVEDSQGFTHDIDFTRPTEVDMWVAITVEVDSDIYGGGVEADGSTELEEALVALGNALIIGEDIVINRFLATAMEVAGVLDVTLLKIDDVDPAINTANIVLAARELAVFSTARITVTVA